MAIPLDGCILIEPVWNRNARPVGANRKQPINFNRTSMESKLIKTLFRRAKVLHFNRTSMESKRLLISQLLLVIPNFNRTSMESKRHQQQLSNSQVYHFNRTSMESKLITFHKPILIICIRLPNFNRTSMESKLITMYFFNKTDAILIEPVWNRNEA